MLCFYRFLHSELKVTAVAFKETFAATDPVSQKALPVLMAANTLPAQHPNSAVLTALPRKPLSIQNMKLLRSEVLYCRNPEFAILRQRCNSTNQSMNGSKILIWEKPRKSWLSKTRATRPGLETVSQ